MSRSNNTEIISPSKRTFEWNGDQGGFKWYDKENKENKQVPYPFRFLVLDKLTTIRGFSDADQKGFWSNEIRDIKKDLLTVKIGNEIQTIGTYEQIKKKLSSKGADFAQVVFIAFYNEEKKLAIGKIILKGCALAPWFDFCKDNKVMEVGVVVKSHKEGKKGKTVFQSPVYEVLTVSDETNALAVELDKELQEYLKQYFNLKNTSSETEENKPEVSRTTEVEKGNKNPVQVAETADDLTDDNDDLPF